MLDFFSPIDEHEILQHSVSSVLYVGLQLLSSFTYTRFIIRWRYTSSLNVFFPQQPHNILQRKLLEATLSRNRLNNRNMKPPYNQTVENDLIQVVCQVNKTHYGQGSQFAKYTPEHTSLANLILSFLSHSAQCFGKDMLVTINTGCTLNLISSVSVEKFG